ncbi:hypothetical protein HOK51_04095 [Candidatus Woesearchaeota archaeon]|jgi:hypothetical protein|nr:hypothetical protein [Candidatus Woesearchaeota archaeon]MBT6519003.1 hypothetical protein [Candidatus Woesearchaeota archaeon]MBT7368798.1 hypothetical protein [Candidatus Woesearchaeota archaeon]
MKTTTYLTITGAIIAGLIGAGCGKKQEETINAPPTVEKSNNQEETEKIKQANAPESLKEKMKKICTAHDCFDDVDISKISPIEVTIADLNNKKDELNGKYVRFTGMPETVGSQYGNAGNYLLNCVFISDDSEELTVCYFTRNGGLNAQLDTNIRHAIKKERKIKVEGIYNQDRVFVRNIEMNGNYFKNLKSTYNSEE